MFFGFIFLFVPASLAFFCLWKLTENELKFYKKRYIKAYKKLEELDFNFKKMKWDD